jgi:ABC-type Na+ efflux pump permease subunit
MAARLYEQGKGWLLPAAGILASLVGFTLIAIGLWATPDSDGYWKITAIASILTVSLAQVCWLRWWEWKSYPSHEPGKRARDTLARYSWYASVLMVSVLALLASSAIILEIRFGLFWRWVALFAIVNGLINLTVPVLTRITSPGYPDRSQSN